MKTSAFALLLAAALLFGCVCPLIPTNATPTPTSTPFASPTPHFSPTATPSDLQERCTGSGGAWTGYEGPFACECGREKVYNTTTYECQRCPPGQLVGRGLGPAFCYTPTGRNGQPCDRSTDCSGGSCVLVNESAPSGKGECHDLPFGCFVRIDANGSFDPDEMLCVD